MIFNRLRPGRARLRRVRLIAFDLDGVFTDGGVWFGPGGGEWKRLGYRDLDGYFALRRAGWRTAVITGEKGELPERFLARLNPDHARQGCKAKLAALDEMLLAEGITREQVAYVGDSTHDLEVLRAVGLGIAPADAHPRARAAARWVLGHRGGYDAVGELAEAFLKVAPGGQA
ncbi:MAG: HAD hydrolase family protein [Spirochaetes bacterium]|nr:HAD hydrolase family protein [Spirochaetota bacterium]